VLGLNVYYVPNSQLAEIVDTLNVLTPHGIKIEYIHVEQLAHGTDVEIECTALVSPEQNAKNSRL
jgi:hypothetical protein